jgi:hypothetical protein
MDVRDVDILILVIPSLVISSSQVVDGIRMPDTLFDLGRVSEIPFLSRFSKVD